MIRKNNLNKRRMTPRFLSPVPQEDLKDIRSYLSSHNLGVNKYRVRVGEGVSQCFGIVGKRCLPPDLSRQSWLHPELHHYLMKFAEKHVPIPFTSIQVNCNYTCAPHKDLGNTGDSYIIAFGPYCGGPLHIEGMDYDIYYRGLLFDGSKLTHSTKPWFGYRYSLVFHTLAPLQRWNMIMPSIHDYKTVIQDGYWKIQTIDGSLLWKKHGLPHPLKNKKKAQSTVDVRSDNQDTQSKQS